MNITPPEQVGILTQAGLQQMQIGNYAGAIQKFDEALVIIPTSIHALQGRAFCKSLLCIVNLQLTPDQMRNYVQEIILDLESATEALRHTFK